MKPLRFLLPRCILSAILGGGLAITGYAATYTVINTNDGGAGSLRQAIIEANATDDPDTIEFNIPGDGPHTIAPVDDALPPIVHPVVIDGYSQPGASANTLVNGINADLRIVLDGSNLEGAANGLAVETSDSTIKGLVIHSFPVACVALGKLFLFGLSGNKVEGNFIGTDVTGTTAPGSSGRYGVQVNATENVIGGSAPAARNLISGNPSGAVYLQSSLNIVQGNFIGTDITGTQALPNFSGVSMFSSGGNQIGGTETGTGNVISGNDNDGISVGAVGAQNNTIKGNFIGTDITGTIPLGNGGKGVSVFDSSNLVIGDDGPNVIAYNLIGISIDRTISVGIEILSNSIHSNTHAAIGGLGLNAGATNDECDEDYGANDLQNFPVLVSAVSDCEITITGSLDSIPETAYRVQFFASPECDSTGYGEGKVFLGETSVALGATCVKEFEAALPGGLRTGWVVTATATDPGGNTSIFSACVETEVGVDYWAEEVDLGGGWKWVDWFGTYNTSTSPWFNHDQHRFLYYFEADPCNLFFYEDTMHAWWWTLPNIYPFVYRFSDEAWLYYLLDTVNPRWFYNYKTEVWEEW